MIKDSKVEEIKVLIEELNSASEAYYKYDREIMSNFEYDEKYDRFVFLEKEAASVFGTKRTNPSIYMPFGNAASKLPH